MFTPRFTEDSTRLSYALEEIERIRFRIERMLIMPKHEQWLRREAVIRNAYSSTMVENVNIPEQEMEKVASLSPISSIPKDRPEVVNYAMALEFIDFLSDSEIKPDEAVVRQIHWILMRGIHDTHIKPGDYRTGPNWIEDQGVKVYDPPFHIDIPILMREFSVWLREDENINPMLKAGIAHAHLIAIHPFVDGNGRTARLLAMLLLQRQGYGFRKLLSLDAYYQRNRDEYLEALQQSLGKRFTNDYDLTPWLEFFTKSVTFQAMKLEQKLTDWRIALDELHKSLRPLGLSERQIDGLIYAFRIGYLTRKDYAEITNVSPLTATRDLAVLVEKGLLMPEGVGRNRRYSIPKEAKQKEELQRRLL